MENAPRHSDGKDGSGGASQDGDGGIVGDDRAAHEGAPHLPHLFRSATELMLADRPLRADGAGRS